MAYFSNGTESAEVEGKNWLDVCEADWRKINAEVKKLRKALEIYRNYLTRNGYGIQLHDIEKEIQDALKGEGDD